MRVKHCVVVAFLSLCSFVLEIGASSCSEELARLPKLFHIIDNEQCPDGQLYCKVNVKLKPKNADNPPEIWKLIQKKSLYERDLIIRAFCVGGESIEEKLGKELAVYNLTAEIKPFCYEKRTVFDEFGLLETCFGLFGLAYLGFIIYSTIKTYNPKNEVNKYQKMFSLINTWKEIYEPKRNEDFQNLLSIQGMRTLAMTVIVTAHSTIFLMIMAFIKNPEYFEDATESFVLSILHGSFSIIVQIYFLISAWLLSVQLHNLIRKNGDFTMKDLFILWLNRYFRLLPAIVVAVILHSSDTTAVAFSHPYFYSISMNEIAKCKSAWWKNLLFVQNIPGQDGEVCALGMWYLAADMHLYMISSTIFYISKKFNISMKKQFGLMAFAVALIQIYNVSTTEYDGVLRFNSRLLPPEETGQRPELVISYVRTYGSAITYIIGFAFGTFYSCNKKTNIFNTPMRKLLFYVGFLCIPALASYLGNIHVNRLYEAILAVGLRPLFSFGIAIGLLGMVSGNGGYMKRFFESFPMVFLGNMTYSIYMFHFVFVFARASMKASYLQLSDSYCYGVWIIDIIGSFALGFLAYVILEHPCVKLQKDIIPQLTSRRKKDESKVE